jgi:hypothetical protein
LNHQTLEPGRAKYNRASGAWYPRPDSSMPIRFFMSARNWHGSTTSGSFEAQGKLKLRPAELLGTAEAVP